MQDPEALTTPIIIPEEPNDSFPVLRGSVALEAVAEGEGEEGGQEDDGEATVEVLDMDGREVTVTEISGGQMVDTEVVEPEAQMTSADASPFFGRISIQATIDGTFQPLRFLPLLLGMDYDLLGPEVHWTSSVCWLPFPDGFTCKHSQRCVM